jgi:hypothetical protein
MLAPMNVPPLSVPHIGGRGAVPPIQALIAAALYLLLGFYSGHLMVCGAEFCGHEDGELAHLKSDTDGSDWRNERALIRAAFVRPIMAGAGGSPVSVPVDVPTPVAVALFIAAVLFLAMARLDRSFPARRIGQRVGRWHRTVVLLI